MKHSTITVSRGQSRTSLCVSSVKKKIGRCCFENSTMTVSRGQSKKGLCVRSVKKIGRFCSETKNKLLCPIFVLVAQTYEEVLFTS